MTCKQIRTQSVRPNLTCGLSFDELSDVSAASVCRWRRHTCCIYTTFKRTELSCYQYSRTSLGCHESARLHPRLCLPSNPDPSPCSWWAHRVAALYNFFQAPRSPSFPELAEGLHISSGLETPWIRVVIVSVVNKSRRNAGFFSLSEIVHEACCW